jgi:hypothetical protein
VFFISKGTLDDLKSSVSLMRIKFSTGLEDFVIKKLNAEMDERILS